MAKTLLLILLCCPSLCFADTTPDFFSKIDVHFNFELEEWNEVDKYWKFKLDQTWFTPWEEWIVQTKRYKKLSDEGKSKLLSQIKAVDERVGRLKESVNVIVHSDKELPLSSYCVLPRGFKASRFVDWVKLPRDMIPMSLMFFPDLMDYFLGEYNKDDRESKWLSQMRSRDAVFHNRETNRAMVYALEWAKKQEDHIKVGYVIFAQTPYFSATMYDENYNTNYVTVPLSESGFEFAPAVAWRCPPKLPENPMKYGMRKVGK